MDVIVACEESQIVCKAFRDRGHNAYSCDLEPCSGGHHGWHIQDDVLKHLDDGWDLMIAHPPCTYLCSSGLHWNNRVEGRKEKTETALDFVRDLLGAPIRKIALENPAGCIGTRIRKSDQKIQPWQFGHDASKGTFFWLKNLLPLKHTEIIPPGGWQQIVYAMDCICCPDCNEPFCEKHELHYFECDCIGPTEDGVTQKIIDGYEFGIREENSSKPTWGNQTPTGQNNLDPSEDRSKLRSLTYPGIAKAMAEQWGDLPPS